MRLWRFKDVKNSLVINVKTKKREKERKIGKTFKKANNLLVETEFSLYICNSPHQRGDSMNILKR